MSSLATGSTTLRRARADTVHWIQRGVTPFIKSSPGMGKSAMVRSIANEYNLQLLDVRLSTCAPEDLNGLPMLVDGVARFVPFANFPLESTPLPEGKNGWLLFLDEANSAPKSVQAACYKIVLDRQVDLYNLHPQCAIVMAGNHSTDRAIVNSLSTAMQSRLATINVELNFQEFMEDVCYPQNWDSRIIAYLQYMPSKLHIFRPDHQNDTFECPRTWEFVNRCVAGVKELDLDMLRRIGQVITPGVAAEFVQFSKNFDKLPRIEDIVKSPESTPLPAEREAQFATTIYLQEQTTAKNFAQTAAYANRLHTELRVLFFRGLIRRKPALRNEAPFRQAVMDLRGQLYDS